MFTSLDWTQPTIWACLTQSCKVNLTFSLFCTLSSYPQSSCRSKLEWQQNIVSLFVCIQIHWNRQHYEVNAVSGVLTLWKQMLAVSQLPPEMLYIVQLYMFVSQLHLLLYKCKCWHWIIALGANALINQSWCLYIYNCQCTFTTVNVCISWMSPNPV